SSPHLRTGDSTHKVMLLVILALIPAVLASVWFFGWNALRVVVYCMAFCALFEYPIAAGTPESGTPAA
ncbi:MAG: RnfABCDGE type electron transport complex subunit D, partial [Agathobacter sp.]|nr:RnfABCDGE type electron transport complex subunit D [Agathobacter sp.]